jgi:hypothetical protein
LRRACEGIWERDPLRLVARGVAHNANTRFKTMNVKSVLDILLVEAGHHGRGRCSPFLTPRAMTSLFSFAVGRRRSHNQCLIVFEGASP